jgi:hypothetical protein
MAIAASGDKQVDLTQVASLGDSGLDEDESRWLEESTAASNVPLYVEDPDVIADLANLLTLSKRS